MIIYESFENLEEIKKQSIINAGFKVFGEYGYSKASIEEIIREAGISKGSLFYYFKSKKNFFLYLYEYCADRMKHLIDMPGPNGLPVYLEHTDFFERIEAVKEMKIRLSLLYPYMNSFMKKAAFESSAAVYDEVQRINLRLTKERTTDFFYNLDTGKFKDGIDPKMVLQLLNWCSEGCMNYVKAKNMILSGKSHNDFDFTEVLALYDTYADMIRKYFYREDYL